MLLPAADDSLRSQARRRCVGEGRYQTDPTSPNVYRHNMMAMRVSPIRLLFPRMADEADLGGGGIMFMVGGLVAVTIAFGFFVLVLVI